MKSCQVVFLMAWCLPVAGLTGCMTSLTVVKRAKGEYLWPQPERSKKPPLTPMPAYYALLPLTVPFDVVTAPAQIPFFVMWLSLAEQEKVQAVSPP